MNFSFTGLTYLLGFFAVGLLAYRFFQYWRKEKTIVSKGFFYFALSFALFMLITAVAGLFFAHHTQILRWVVILAALIQSFAFAIASYLIVHLKFPRASPRLAAIIVFLLGLITTFLTIATPFIPYLEKSGGINWDIQHNQPLVDIFRFFLFLVTFLPLMIILFQQRKTSTDPTTKIRAFGLSLVLIFAILISLFDFVLENILALEAVSSDMATGVLSIIIFLIIWKTQKPPVSEKELKEYKTPPAPKISW